jgi:hypothetical protein
MPGDDVVSALFTCNATVDVAVPPVPDELVGWDFTVSNGIHDYGNGPRVDELFTPIGVLSLYNGQSIYGAKPISYLYTVGCYPSRIRRERYNIQLSGKNGRKISFNATNVASLSCI